MSTKAITHLVECSLVPELLQEHLLPLRLLPPRLLSPLRILAIPLLLRHRPPPLDLSPLLLPLGESLTVPAETLELAESPGGEVVGSRFGGVGVVDVGNKVGGLLWKREVCQPNTDETMWRRDDDVLSASSRLIDSATIS